VLGRRRFLAENLKERLGGSIFGLGYTEKCLRNQSRDIAFRKKHKKEGKLADAICVVLAALVA